MRRGLTLLELLVAMALSLLLIFALGQFFVYVTGTISDGRAIVEMGGNIRGAVRQLRDDLQSVTASATPPLDSSSGSGFIEIVEGAAYDMDVEADGTMDVTATMQGDIDDILSFTIRSAGSPFVGQWFNPATSSIEQVESHLAEVVWFTTFKDTNGNGTWQPDEQRFLVRRQLLIAPNLTLGTSGQPQDFFQENDISARPTATGWVANALADLTQRENRFIHLDLDFSDGSQNGLRAADATQPQAFMPNPLQLQVGSTASLQRYTLQGGKFGEDIVLPNLLALDARVYDPTAPLYADSDKAAALQPGDPGFAAAVGLPMAQPEGWGAYVDPNYIRYMSGLTLASQFSGPGQYGTSNYVTWDTWSTYYERDGNDQFADGKVDWAYDGLDNNPTPTESIVDDGTEVEAQPPYSEPIRGVQVRIRMYEPGTRQTRQATVVSSF